MAEIEMCIGSTIIAHNINKSSWPIITEEDETPEDVQSIDDDDETLEDVQSIDDDDDDDDYDDDDDDDELEENLKDLLEEMKTYVGPSNRRHSLVIGLVDRMFIENLACKIKSGSVLAIILEELLKSVFQPRASFDDDCKTHYKIVKTAWQDIQLNSLLLQERDVLCEIWRYEDEFNEQLLDKLTPLIKAHPPMKDILRESEASSVRGTLTILLGYLSNKHLFFNFDGVMGDDVLIGIRTFRYSCIPDDIKVEPPISASGAFMEPPSYTLELDALMPEPSLVTRLLHDESFKDVAQQIQCNCRGAEFAEHVLLNFKSKYNVYIPSCVRSNLVNFLVDASLNPLRRALKKSPKSSLFSLFKELSDGAEMLRLKERLDRIREDYFLKTIDIKKSDFSFKMRLALSILIGYWSSIDINLTVRQLLRYKRDCPSKVHLLEDLKDVEVISYSADFNHDLKGLKNVLADEYNENSSDFECRVEEIECQQKLIALKAIDCGYDKTSSALITALLKGGRCIYMKFRWTYKVPGLLKIDI